MGPGGNGRRRLIPGARRRAAIAAASVAGCLGLLLAPVQICPFALIFHAPCPGCGLTRAALAMLTGDFRSAAMLHPLCFVLVPLVAFAVGTQAVSYVRTGAFTSGPTEPRGLLEIGAATLIVAMLGVWVARFFGWLGGPVSV